MPKDEKITPPADSGKIKDAIGRLISAGIADLGLRKGEFFNKLELSSAEVTAFNKILSGDRSIDLKQAAILESWVRCDGAKLTAQEWHSLESFPSKIPERFLSTDTYNFKKENEDGVVEEPRESGEKNSTYEVSRASDSSPEKMEEEHITERNTKENKIQKDENDRPRLYFDFKRSVLSWDQDVPPEVWLEAISKIEGRDLN